MKPSSCLPGAANGFRRYNRKTGLWSVLPLPQQSYTTAYVDGERLVAAYGNAYANDEGAFESGIVQWTAATGETALLASSRRRPADDRTEELVGFGCRAEAQHFAGHLSRLATRGCLHR